ncbi:hypothetical protein [Quadrisphaera sp. INWT6]|uniref:hypothetical protein n=1 Tax=Quadrisphaera sp. INWT6 TaxID=2596917 RepID=UPI00189216EF|nr:hypothetical protein [Quadrisphaera sp. INWT6]MBF5082693.1 hypothetical protein [Quadrisphaera sp. INWT6]
MWQWRRSWFQRPRWWVTYLLTAAAAFAVFSALARLGAPTVTTTQAVFLAGVVSVAPAWRTQRDHRAWEQLEMSASAPRAQLEAAEAVVRYRRPSTSAAVLADAIRIGELALEERGSPRGGYILAAVLASAAVVLAVVTSWWWAVVLAGVTALVVVGAVQAGALARRVGEVRAQLAAAEGADVVIDSGGAPDGRG